jgi:hypothetical protein
MIKNIENKNCLPKEVAAEVYKLLVTLLESSKNYKDDFINYLSEPSICSKEYTLTGSLLGDGGKLYYDG